MMCEDDQEIKRALSFSKIDVKIKIPIDKFRNIWYYNYNNKKISVYDCIIKYAEDDILMFDKNHFVYVYHTNYYQGKRELKLKKIHELY